MNNIDPKTNFSENDSIDLSRYIALFLNNWYWFAIALFIAITIAYGINRYSQKIYSVSSTILIKDDQNGGMNSIASGVIPGGDIFKNQQNLRNEMAILKSFSLNYEVMKELTDFHVVYVSLGRRGIVESILYNNCPFIVTYDSLKNQLKNVKIGITIKDEDKFEISIDGDINLSRTLEFGQRFNEAGFNFRIEKRYPGQKIKINGKSNSYYFYFTDPAKLANVYRSKLSVVPKDKDGSLVTLSVSGFVPEQEADYLNTLMSVYIDYGLNIKKQIADTTLRFINEQINVVLVSLESAEDELEKFRRENRFLDYKNESSVMQSKLEKDVIQNAEFELQKKYYNYLANYVNDRGAKGEIISPSVIGITDQVLFRLIGELSIIQQDMQKLELNLDETQPAMDILKVQEEKVREALKENIKNCIISINLAQEETEKRISENERDIKNLPSVEKKFVTIQRQFDLNNTIYTYLLEKRAESGIARASTMADNRKIDPAQLVGIVKPTSRKNLLIALILGILLPAGAISVIDFFNNRVIDRKDIIKKTKVPIIGYISHSDSKFEIAVADKPGSALSESFRSVRTAIKYYVKENEVAVIAISSTVSSEGKTFIAVNLATIIAMLGKRVLLIGLDLRKPRINKIFEFDKSPGMSTYLSGNCKIEEIIKETQIENLYYAPSGPVPPNPAELIETHFMKTFMERAKKEFDYIIFDTPPIAVVTDALLLADYADVNLFIVRQRYTSVNTLELIEQLKNQGELKNMAIVINDISLSGYYGYGLRYGYMQGYGYSYGTAYYGSNYYGKNAKNGKSEGYYIES